MRPSRHDLLTLAALLLLSLAGCATTPPQPAAAAPPPLLLISIDGLRPADVTAEAMPHLSRLADGGVRADGMRPSYPSLTFPNHYTLVTGLRPDRHGIVHNAMHDAALGEFRLSNREAVGDGRWWGGEPVWIGVRRAGKRSATLFWPGSEAAIAGVRPDRWQPYDDTMPVDQRVDTVAGWLLEPASTRPHFATLYFERVDTDSHHHGPDSAEAADARRDVDAAIGRLVHALATRGALDAINIVVVSDHGLADVPAGNVVAIEDMASADEARIDAIGQVVMLAPKPGFEALLETRLLGRGRHHECWRKRDLPERWHYGSHPRIPAIVCQMDEGWDALPKSVIARRGAAGTRGSHGYDPELASMRATFIAHGPAFRAGSRLPVFDNVDVYPLLMRLLDVPPAPNDGDIAPLLPALRSMP